MSLKFQGIHFEKPNDSSWIKKEVLRGPFGNFEVLKGPVLYNVFRTSPKGPVVRWYTITHTVDSQCLKYLGFLTLAPLSKLA